MLWHTRGEILFTHWGGSHWGGSQPTQMEGLADNPKKRARDDTGENAGSTGSTGSTGEPGSAGMEGGGGLVEVPAEERSLEGVPRLVTASPRSPHLIRPLHP